LLEDITERAFRDIIESDKYSYKKFIENFDRDMAERVKPPSRMPLISGVVGWQSYQNSPINNVVNGTDLSRLPISIPLQNFKIGDNLKYQDSVKKRVSKFSYFLFRRYPFFAVMVRIFYEVPFVRKFINYVLS